MKQIEATTFNLVGKTPSEAKTRVDRVKITKWIKGHLPGKKRLMLALVAIALVAAAAYWYFGNRATAAQYVTAKVERGNLRNSVTATGTLQAVTTVQVGSQASGTISALHADFNSIVKKGQVIAQLDPSTTNAQVQQAQANLEQARASLVQSRASVAQSKAGVSDAQAKALAARSTVQNQQAGVSGAEANLAVLKAQMDDAASVLRQEESLLSSGVISRREYETAQMNFKTAQARHNQAVSQVNQAVLSEKSSAGAGIAQSQAQIQQTQAQVQQSQAQVQQAEAQVQQAAAALQLAQIGLSHTTIRSPIDGVVVSRDVNVGQTVAASLSAPTLFTIANDLTQMQVIANIDQADIGLVEQAKEVKFTVDAFPEAEFKGTIQQMRLNPVTVQNVVTYNVMIDVSNPEQKLKPGMTANLEITIDERNNVLKVPNSALRFTPQALIEQRQQGDANATSGQGSRRGRQQTDSGATPASSNSTDGAQPERTRERMTPASSPVLNGQTRRVWVLGQDGQPQQRRIKVGLTDGAATEVLEGDLREGEVVITGQSVTSGTTQPTGQTPPGFGGAPRTGGGRGGGGGGRQR